MGGRPLPGYLAPCELARRPITSTVTKAEHEHLSALARAAGIPATTYATRVLRQHLAAQPTMPVRTIDAAEVA